jgi:hypothetical protein
MSDTAQWITLLTVIVGFVYQAWREQRNRRWDKEDRAELAALAARGNKALGEKIDVNTEISTRAFHEANSVNLKIEKLGLEHNQLQRDRQEK